MIVFAVKAEQIENKGIEHAMDREFHGDFIPLTFVLSAIYFMSEILSTLI